MEFLLRLVLVFKITAFPLLTSGGLDPKGNALFCHVIYLLSKDARCKEFRIIIMSSGTFAPCILVGVF
jgi:hypothetical protein